MSQIVEHLARNTSSAIHKPASVAARSISLIDHEPKVVITGDIRLHITDYDAAHFPAKGHYTIETEGLLSPFHIIWIVNGHVIAHSGGEIEIAFDMRGRTAGEIVTRQLSVQVTAQAGQGLVVNSSVFIQIVVIPHEIQVANKNHSQTLNRYEQS